MAAILNTHVNFSSGTELLAVSRETLSKCVTTVTTNAELEMHMLV